MRFSIIVPVFKTEAYLRECVDSILNQSYQDYEIILVDDGSPDACPQMCDEYAAAHECIQVVHQQNRGLLLARRAGISIAKGDYVMHVDSDDYLLEGALQRIHDTLIEYPVDLLFFDYISGKSSEVEEKRIKIRDEESVTTFETTKEKEKLQRQILVGGFLGSLSIKVTKRTIVDVNVDYSPWRTVANGEDQFQSFPLIDKAQSFVYLPEPLYYYRRDNESMSKRYGEKDFDSFKFLQNKKIEYARKWELYNEIEEKLALSYFDKNMVILRDVFRYQRDALDAFLKTLCNDKLVIDTINITETKQLSVYYRLLRHLIKRKSYKAIIALLTVVNGK